MKRFLLCLLLAVLLIVPSATALTLTKVANPATLPVTQGIDVDFSPGGEFMVVSHSGAPFITIYEITQPDTFTKLPDPAVLPPGAAFEVDFSNDGNFLAVAHATSPFITIYSISGTTFTKISDPADLPTGIGAGLSFSYDSSKLAVAHTTTPFLTVYSISGTTFTKLSNPATLPTGDGQGVAWKPGDAEITVGHLNSPFISAYTVSGSTLTKVVNPGTLPAGAGNAVDYSPDGQFLAVAHPTTPFVTMYDISGAVWIRQSNPLTLPTGTGSAVAFSPDGQFLTVGHVNSPFITTYSISNTLFTKIADPSTLPTGTGSGVAWSPTQSYMAVAHSTTPFVTIYATGESFDDELIPTAPSGLSAEVTAIQGPGGSTIRLLWRVSSNDPDQDTGEFSYVVYLNGELVGPDSVTGADGDGIRSNTLNIVHSTSANYVIWIVAKNGFLASPASCSVVINDGSLNARSCGNQPTPIVGGGSGGGTPLPSDVGDGLRGFTVSLLGGSEASLFFGGLIYVVVAFLAVAAAYVALTKATGAGPVVAGIIPALGVMVMNIVQGIWAIVWGIIMITAAAAMLAYMIKKTFFAGDSGGGDA